MRRQSRTCSGRRVLSAGLASLALLVVLAPGAAARNLNLSQLGAAVVLPFATDSRGTLTYLTVTNALRHPLDLRVHVIDGDPGDGWGATSFRCHVTGRETTLFAIRHYREGLSVMDLECSDPMRGPTPPYEGRFSLERREAIPAERGLVFVSVRWKGTTVSEDALFGDAVVMDPAAGVAWSASGIPFQAGTANDGNGEYRFDGREYAHFPSVVAGTFPAPDPAAGLSTQLILFTLDSQVGHPPPVQVSVHFWNENTRMNATDFAFDGFTIVDLEDIDPRFERLFLGSDSGHLQIESFATDHPSAHDADGLRRVPVHGWIVHTRTDGTKTRASAWPLRASTGRFVPLDPDVPALETGLPSDPPDL